MIGITKGVHSASDTEPLRVAEKSQQYFLQYSTLGTRLFGLADSAWVVSVWTVTVCGHFGLSRYGLWTFWSDYEMLRDNILMQTYLNQRKVLFKKNYKHDPDPTVNQHQHTIFIIISEQIKSLSTFCN